MLLPEILDIVGEIVGLYISDDPVYGHLCEVRQSGRPLESWQPVYNFDEAKQEEYLNAEEDLEGSIDDMKLEVRNKTAKTISVEDVEYTYNEMVQAKTWYDEAKAHCEEPDDWLPFPRTDVVTLDYGGELVYCYR